MGCRIVIVPALVLIGVTVIAADSARASWLRTSELTYNSAYTLEQGETAVGLIHPLQYGISDRVQLTVHPLLVLIGTPNLSVRWRVFKSDNVAIATSFGTIWSLLHREGPLGETDESEVDVFGFPGTTQLTGTASFDVGRGWLLSAGAGVAADYLDIEPVRLLLELHGSVQWLLGPEDLLMLHLASYFAASTLDTDDDVVRRPVAQLTYAHAWGKVHLAVGIAVGSFPIAEAAGVFTDWPVFPVIDVWWRL